MSPVISLVMNSKCGIFTLLFCLQCGSLLSITRRLEMVDAGSRSPMVGGSWPVSRRCACVSHRRFLCWQRAGRARSLHAKAAYLLIAACQDLSSAQLCLLSQTAFQLNCLSRH